MRTGEEEVSLTPKQLEAFLFVQANEPMLFSRLRRHFPNQARALIEKGALCAEEREREANVTPVSEIHAAP